MEIHIGEEIKKRLEELRMPYSEFAAKVYKSPSTVNDILTRRSVNTELLYEISKVLEFDFFKLYSKNSKNNFHVLLEPEAEYGKNALMKQLADCQTQVNVFKKESEYFEKLTSTQSRTIELLEEKLRLNKIK